LIVDREFWRLDIKPFIWPAAVIALGLLMIFRKKKGAKGMLTGKIIQEF